MRALTKPNIESELSYAYLHAVASQAGMACSPAGRHEDNNGIDAHVTAWEPFTNGGYLTEVNLNIQLKATYVAPTETATHFSFSLRGIQRYDDLRTPTVNFPRFLVVLYLPPTDTDWLVHSVDELILKRCAYWVSLRNAPAVVGQTSTTVYLPKAQVFSPDQLRNLAAELSHPGKHFDYLAP
ncbi:MAG: DUF4365 domain-containing protein [Flavobacteriales bacterium]|nr:DUF4365 domain-containing protein [Flavobacteriales bacterium]